MAIQRREIEWLKAFNDHPSPDHAFHRYVRNYQRELDSLEKTIAENKLPKEDVEVDD